MSKEPKVSRRSRKWLAAWTYGSDDIGVASEIRDGVLPDFESELLEVFVPVVEHEGGVHHLSTPGYIFLRVAEPSEALLKAVKRVKGVGGFLTDCDTQSCATLEEPSVPFSQFVQGDVVKVSTGDLVKVAVGPLRGSAGAVVGTGREGVIVNLRVFGTVIRASFQWGEVVKASE